LNLRNKDLLAACESAKKFSGNARIVEILLFTPEYFDLFLVRERLGLMRGVRSARPAIE